MTLFIFTQQKASLPSWAPFVGEEFVHITGEFETAQAVAPGQGQAVDIAGIQVGKITSVALEDGHAVVGMDIEPKYMDLIHPDATLLMRPKTNLNDMVVEVARAPARATSKPAATSRWPRPNRTPTSTPSSRPSTPTPASTSSCCWPAAPKGSGNGRQLSGAFRRFQPFVHYVADINKAVAERRLALAGVIHNFGSLTTELGRRDAEIERFVSGSQASLGNFANEQEAIQESLVEFPATLVALRAGLASSKRFTTVARPALIGLIPQAQALTPAFKATESFFAETTAPIRDQIRPFTRQIRPVLTHLNEGSNATKKTITGFGNALGAFNSFFNELAYKPQGSKQSFLFYLPWLNHDLNADFNLQDAGSPVQRGVILISCTGSSLGYGLAELKPFLKTLLQGARIPRAEEIPEPSNPSGHCEYLGK